jgi:hypothetical protein
MTEPESSVASSAAVIDASRSFMAVAERQNTLYDLSSDYVQILDLLESGEDDETLELELNRVAGKIANKAEAIAGLVAHLNGIAGMRRAEAERLRNRAQSDERQAERLKGYLLKNMRTIGQERIETARFTLSIRQNPPAVNVLEEMLIPDEYIKKVLTTSVDKRAILEHVKATGEVVPGVELTRGTRLDIK